MTPPPDLTTLREQLEKVKVEALGNAVRFIREAGCDCGCDYDECERCKDAIRAAIELANVAREVLALVPASPATPEGTKTCEKCGHQLDRIGGTR